jgi:hypothetical protein
MANERKCHVFMKTSPRPRRQWRQRQSKLIRSGSQWSLHLPDKPSMEEREAALDLLADTVVEEGPFYRVDFFEGGEWQKAIEYLRQCDESRLTTAPIVVAAEVRPGSERDPAVSLIIQKCSYCGKRHVHSADAGHRVAHCVGLKGQPGYVLMPSEMGA